MDIAPYIQMVRQDIGQLDITSELLPPQRATARIVAKEDGYVSGIGVASAIFSSFLLESHPRKSDGDSVSKGDVLIEIEGDIRTLLSVERTVLNILQRMCGITTAVKRCVDLAPGVRIAATRKTLMPALDKMAVLAGGGDPHRWRLDDMYLIKDNHLAILGIAEAVHKAKATLFSKKVEIEVENLAHAREAAEAGADIILLDNMSPKDIAATIAALRGEGHERVLFEASGMITPETLPEYAKTGVDIVSMGALTHSVKALDISMDIQQ